MLKIPRVVTASALLLGVGLVALVPAAPPAAAATGTFSNTGLITIPAGAPGTTLGNATPYGSNINVTGLSGLITDVNVTLSDIGHTHADDLDILLVSPSGDSTVLMSDACDGTDFEDFDWTFDDSAANTMPDNPAGTCNSFFYKPSQYDDASDTWPAAYPGPHGTTLARFNGENPLGLWSLYVRDDSGGDVGDIEGGWSITITTGPADIAIPGTGTVGVANPYPRVVNISDTGVITDVNVTFTGMTHAHPDDMDILMVGPAGQKVMLMSDSCGSFDVVNYQWTFDDEAPSEMADSGSTNVCSAFNYQPTDNGGTEDLAAPAPVGPYSTNLSVFDQKFANGGWEFFIQDDVGGDAGFLVNPPSIQVTTRPRAAAKFASATLNVAEGGAATLTITRATASTALLPATVKVDSVIGTAGPLDFVPINTTVAFAAGQTSQTVPVTASVDTLVEGPETFTVALSNPTGDLVLAAPSTATVTIVPAGTAVAPDTTLDKGPQKNTTSRKAKITFSSTVAGSTFECTVDKKKWKSCKSPLKLKNLSVGKHKVKIRATAGGLTEAKPLTVKWKVKPKKK